MGAVKSFGTGGNDRLLVIGGSDGDSSVFYSDDCGASWTCNNSTEVFTAARYRWLVDVPGVSLPYAPLLFGGGYAEPDGPGMLVPSIGVFVTADAGITWNRPLCVDQSNPGVTCTNPVPDEKRGGFAWAMSDTPTAPGMIARDSTTVYFFNAFPDPGADPVQYLNVSNYKIGWLPLPNGNTDGMYGRKAWLQGGSASVGCVPPARWRVALSPRRPPAPLPHPLYHTHTPLSPRPQVLVFDRLRRGRPVRRDEHRGAGELDEPICHRVVRRGPVDAHRRARAVGAARGRGTAPHGGGGLQVRPLWRGPVL